MASRERKEKMNNISKIKKMVGTGVLLALVIVLQLLSNYVKIGTISITLALIPLAMGAILYGPITGMVLGLAIGAIIIVAPDTQTFLNFNVWLTILLCLVKTGLAGLVSGLLYRAILKLKFLKKAKVPVATIIAALICPIINTGIFILGVSTMFVGLDMSGLVVSSNFGEAFVAIYGAVVTINFLIEFLVSTICSPALVYLTKVLAKQNDLGFQKAIKDNLINKENNNNFDEIDSDKLFS